MYDYIYISVYHLHTLKHVSYVYPNIPLKERVTHLLMKLFFHSGCEQMVCRVSSNFGEGRGENTQCVIS
jgi:hypothetical protein